MPVSGDESHLLSERALSEAVLNSPLGQKFVDSSPAWETIADSILYDNMLRALNDSAYTVSGQAIPAHGVPLYANTDLHLTMNQFPTISPLLETFISPRGQIGNLNTRTPPTPMASRNVHLLLQGLRTFPQKMIQANDRPFFIHSYKHRDALPEPLAVCSRICQMFDTRTPDILPFIWRCIRTEELRYVQEVCYTDHDKI